MKNKGRDRLRLPLLSNVGPCLFPCLMSCACFLIQHIPTHHSVLILSPFHLHHHRQPSTSMDTTHTISSCLCQSTHSLLLVLEDIYLSTPPYSSRHLSPSLTHSQSTLTQTRTTPNSLSPPVITEASTNKRKVRHFSTTLKFFLCIRSSIAHGAPPGLLSVHSPHTDTFPVSKKIHYCSNVRVKKEKIGQTSQFVSASLSLPPSHPPSLPPFFSLVFSFFFPLVPHPFPLSLDRATYDPLSHVRVPKKPGSAFCVFFFVSCHSL